MIGSSAVVVVGGGYAGVMAANRLARRDGVRVTLVNPRAKFVERIRLHQLAGGSDDAVVEFEDVLAQGVQLLIDSVTRIDAGGRTVTLATGGTLGYDYLIYAVGSRSAEPAIPGVAEFTYPMGDLEQAERLRAVLRNAPADTPVTVVGAGPTGIETAAELAEAGHIVTLVCGDVLGPYLHPRGRRSVAERLTQLGVTVLEGPEAMVTAVTRHVVHLSGGHTLRNSLTIWAAGFGVPDLAARSGLSTDALGRLYTDETLTSLDDAHIVAAGDAAAPSGHPFRMSCQAAVQLGPQAAETVLSRLAGEQPKPVDVSFVGQCISLGRRTAISQFASKDDTPNRYYLAGYAGAKLKELVCKSTIWQLAHEARRPGALSTALSVRKGPRAGIPVPDRGSAN